MMLWKRVTFRRDKDFGIGVQQRGKYNLTYNINILKVIFEKVCVMSECVCCLIEITIVKLVELAVLKTAASSAFKMLHQCKV